MAVLGLLFAAHLPWLLSYYSDLMNRQHYEFAPLAFIVMGALAWSRGNFGEMRLQGVKFWVPLSIDALLLASGIWLNSPWLVAAGFVCLLYAIFLNLPDKDYQCSLWSLTLLPALTIRPPLNYDVQLIQWLQPLTTRCSSHLLNFCDAFHLREGNVIEFPGKRFLVEEACSGVQSLFTVLFLAVVVACLQRRRHVIIVALMCCGVFFAGVTNVIRVLTVTLAWAYFEVDLSSGWQHDVLGYAALFVAAGLTLSADAFLACMTAPVPSEQMSKGTHAKTVFWNRMMNILPRSAVDA